MIKLSNDHILRYVTASGALSYDGKGWPWEKLLVWLGFLKPELFTNFGKTVTLLAWKGNFRWYNPFRCLRWILNGILNAFGLTNPGFAWWCKHVGPYVDSKKIPLVLSIHGTPEELAEMSREANHYDLVGIEINKSCPNIEGGILRDTADVIASCEAVKANSRHPIILKLSVKHDIEHIVPAVEHLVEAFAINSVPWDVAFPGKRSPLARFGGGGVSGKAAQPFTWDMISRLVKLTTIPVIGPSIWEFGDIEKVRKLGALAVSFGSIFLWFPWRPTRYAKKDMRT